MQSHHNNQQMALVVKNDEIAMWRDPAKLQEIRQMISTTPLSDIEFSALVGLGRATGLNPFLREIWAIKYRNGAPASIFIGRDGYRKAAQRQKDYGYHQVNAIYTNDDFKIVNDEIHHSFGLKDRGELIGAYCKVKRRSFEKYAYVIVRFDEYNLNQGLWKQGIGGKPETMIKKVAEAQALRMCFQEVLGGTYSDAELPQEQQQHEPRVIDAIKGETQTDKLKNLLDVNMQTGEVLPPDPEDTDTTPISDKQILEIESIMLCKGFSMDRQEKVKQYILKTYKVEGIEQLTSANAIKIIEKLRQAS